MTPFLPATRNGRARRTAASMSDSIQLIVLLAVGERLLSAPWNSRKSSEKYQFAGDRFSTT